MIAVMCVAQAGQIPAEAAESLEAEISAFTHRSFDDAPAFSWVTVPESCGFTAGEPSTSMIVSARSNRPLPRDERAVLLKELCEICATETGKSVDELVLVISDPEQA